MSNVVTWLENHDKLAGWAQFFGATFALLITYLTAFAPVWRRKRQMKKSADRLLSNGYETIESYHRTSAHFLPFPLSLRQAALTMTIVAEEISRFPVFELDDQGSRSAARHLLATSATLSALRLFLETMAVELDGRDGTVEDQEAIRSFVGDRLEAIRTIITGSEIKRPVWPTSPDGLFSTSQ
ncbi:hypothetical protein M0208_14135 [Sphingomonas sp. SUN019]|uniref:hypothetical protein n=1 Tax=Sphingomonas sp. SUN019 TaxID=2937788 RepID=UPI002164404E|nr:hypothetical protein [Sphingomonas sp. SUN019]UVO51587.1 hypothetical protein M0208_14135 [Sphingomonas sp. SUN019]